MVNKNIKNLMFGIGLGLSSLASAVEIGSIESGGTGCEAGSIESEINQLGDGAIRLDVFFSDYGVDVGEEKTIDRKSCGLAIPISLQSNRKLVIEKVHLKVDGLINEDSATTLNAEVFSAGDKGRVVQRKIVPDQEIQGRFILRGNNVYETACGIDTNLRVNTSVVLNSQGTGLRSQLSGHSAMLLIREVSCLN